MYIQNFFSVWRAFHSMCGYMCLICVSGYVYIWLVWIRYVYAWYVWIDMHFYNCGYIYTCATAFTWRSEDNLRCHASVTISCETGSWCLLMLSLVFLCLYNLSYQRTASITDMGCYTCLYMGSEDLHLGSHAYKTNSLPHWYLFSVLEEL